MEHALETLSELEDYINELDNSVGISPDTIIEITEAIEKKRGELKKEDFEVWDKHLDADNSYKPLGDGRWYNDYMYQEALAKNGELSNVREPFMKWGDFFLGLIAGIFLTVVIIGKMLGWANTL